MTGRARVNRVQDLERWHDWFNRELERSGDWSEACRVADLPETVMRKFEENCRYSPAAGARRVQRQLLTGKEAAR